MLSEIMLSLRLLLISRICFLLFSFSYRGAVKLEEKVTFSSEFVFGKLYWVVHHPQRFSSHRSNRPLTTVVKWCFVLYQRQWYSWSNSILHQLIWVSTLASTNNKDRHVWCSIFQWGQCCYFCSIIPLWRTMIAISCSILHTNNDWHELFPSTNGNDSVFGAPTSSTDNDVVVIPSFTNDNDVVFRIPINLY